MWQCRDILQLLPRINSIHTLIHWIACKHMSHERASIYTEHLRFCFFNTENTFRKYEIFIEEIKKSKIKSRIINYMLWRESINIFFNTFFTKNRDIFYMYFILLIFIDKCSINKGIFTNVEQHNKISLQLKLRTKNASISIIGNILLVKLNTI